MIQSTLATPEQLFHWISSHCGPWDKPIEFKNGASLTILPVDIMNTPILLRLVKSNEFSIFSFEHMYGTDWKPLISVMASSEGKPDFYPFSGSYDMRVFKECISLIEQATAHVLKLAVAHHEAPVVSIQTDTEAVAAG